ncbi:MAG: molybdate ABC transporter substrate-binding protein [Burkholderiales bacterium]
MPPSRAAVLKVFSTNAMRAVLPGLAAGFERSSGHALAIEWSTTAQTLERIGNGETADVVIATDTGVDELARRDRIVAGSRAGLASTLVGIGVRAAAAKPDIGSVQAFTHALLDAKSIAYTTLGQSGLHFEQVIERLGIAAQLKPKFKVIAGGLVGEIVVGGEAEIGVQMVSEILAVEGFELVGPFPPELQQATAFAAAVLDGSRQADAARKFVRFLTTPAATRKMKAHGFEAA